MEHLALEVFNRDGSGSKYAFLPSDTSITITDTSEIFDSGNIWSHAFKLNIPANAHIFGSAGEIHGSRLHEQIDKRRARLWVEGLPLYYGYLRLDDEVDVGEYGDVNVSFESGRKTFRDMIDGAKANQVPLMSDILIGMALDRERTVKRTKVAIARWRDGAGRLSWNQYNCTIKGEEKFAQMYPKYVFPGGDWRTTPTAGSGTTERINQYEIINVDSPYDAAHPYCNIRICYQKKKWENNNGKLEEKVTQEYKVSEPRRINPAPNFYVLYWLDCLMKHLNIHIEENQMMDIEDLRRLFFVNTKCAYLPKGDTYYGNPLLFPTSTNGAASPFVPIPSEDNKSWEIKMEVLSGRLNNGTNYFQRIGDTDAETDRRTCHKAYATSDNFPDVDINDTVEAIENGFGARLLFNSDFTKVRIVLLRNVLGEADVQDMPCDIVKRTKLENGIRGFRLTYGGGEDDTNYNYKGFSQAKIDTDGGWIKESDLHDYSQWNTTLLYSKIKEEVGMLNKTCYIDMSTGNAYIVKIDSNFKSMGDNANPALFECGQFMDAEDGDCTGEDETIKEVKIGFSPMVSNAMKTGGYALFVPEEMSVPLSDNSIPSGPKSITLKKGTITTNSAGTTEENGTTNVDESDVAAHYGLFEIATETSFVATTDGVNEIFTVNDYEAGGDNAQVRISGMIREGYRIYLEDNYKPGEDLECPLEKTDWGLTLGIMRGSNSGSTDSTIRYLKDTTEGENNDYWEIRPGAIATSHSDTCDDNGNGWVYSAVTPGSSEYTGYEFGDKLLADFGCQNLCDLKNRKGPIPSGLDTYGIIDSYFSYPQGSELILLTNQGYYAAIGNVVDSSGVPHIIWLCCVYGGELKTWYDILGKNGYINYLQYGANSTRPAGVSDILLRDSIGNGTLSNMIIAVDPAHSIDILKTACGYYLKENRVITRYTDDQVSLKLRAEKPNPYFDPSQPESNDNPRYLEITNTNLQRRGLADQFYKEYSYWVRNARIAKLSVRVELAQLLAIDKTKRVAVGDITGFIKKMQFSVNANSGLGLVDMEVWYL